MERAQKSHLRRQRRPRVSERSLSFPRLFHSYTVFNLNGRVVGSKYRNWRSTRKLKPTQSLTIARVVRLQPAALSSLHRSLSLSSSPSRFHFSIRTDAMLRIQKPWLLSSKSKPRQRSSTPGRHLAQSSNSKMLHGDDLACAGTFARILSNPSNFRKVSQNEIAELYRRF